MLTRYLKSHQTKSVYWLHLSVLTLVIVQIILSNFMEVHRDGSIGASLSEQITTWGHIICGSLLIPLGIILFCVAVSQRGASYYFGMFSGNLTPVLDDLRELKSLRLPEAHASGLAPTIQGLGLLILFATAATGGIWLALWLGHSTYSHDAKEVHEFFTTPLEIYVYAHGAMGILHTWLERNK